MIRVPLPVLDAKRDGLRAAWADWCAMLAETDGDARRRQREVHRRVVAWRIEVAQARQFAEAQERDDACRLYKYWRGDVWLFAPDDPTPRILAAAEAAAGD